jgi:hypothetical protein
MPAMISKSLSASAGECGRDLGPGAGHDLDNMGACTLFEAIPVGDGHLQRPSRQACDPYPGQDAAAKLGGCSVGGQHGYMTMLDREGERGGGRRNPAHPVGAIPAAGSISHIATVVPRDRLPRVYALQRVAVAGASALGIFAVAAGIDATSGAAVIAAAGTWMLLVGILAATRIRRCALHTGRAPGRSCCPAMSEDCATRACHQRPAWIR